MLNIIKGSITNVVDESTFKRIYKPNGWRIDESVEIKEEPDINKVKTERELHNLQKMKNTKRKVFNDKIFYSEIENEIKGES